MSHSISFASRRTPLFYVLAGGLTLATLDLTYACSFWALVRDVPPVYLLQYIASGALGKAAFDGGLTTALLGAGFHYAIALVMALVYYWVSGRYRALVPFPVRYGVAYGLLLWGVMTYVVVPLSLAQTPAKIYLPSYLSNLAMHVLLGLICAWSARLAHRARR